MTFEITARLKGKSESDKPDTFDMTKGGVVDPAEAKEVFEKIHPGYIVLKCEAKQQ